MYSYSEILLITSNLFYLFIYLVLRYSNIVRQLFNFAYFCIRVTYFKYCVFNIFTVLISINLITSYTECFRSIQFKKLIKTEEVLKYGLSA